MEQVNYGGQNYSVVGGPDAVEKLESDITQALQEGNVGAFVGFNSPTGVVRLLVSNSTPIAIIGSTDGNPTMVAGW